MDNNTKAVVAFAGARDGYQLPWALSEGDLLEAFVTDMYWPADRRWFSSSVGKLLPEKFVSSRYCSGLDSRTVKIATRAWALSAGEYVAPQFRLNRFRDKSIGRKARTIANRKQAGLFCCSYYASEAFKPGAERPQYRFLFQLHPHPKTVRKILSDELILVPIAEASLKTEPDFCLPERDFEDLCSEPDLANGWVVASNYTAQTLAEHGIAAEKIHVVPYGVDSRAFAKRDCPPAASKPFTIVFVGSLIQRKGLSYLLDTVRTLRSEKIKVLLCGRGIIDWQLIESYSDLDLEIHIGLPRSALIRHMHRADVFVLPSLAEGFAHVVLEAMSCGLPVIATPHTCAPDVLVEGEHGFVVPIRNVEALSEKLAWGIDHRGELALMGDAAAARAGVFTWERFRQRMRVVYQAMLASMSGKELNFV